MTESQWSRILRAWIQVNDTLGKMQRSDPHYQTLCGIAERLIGIVAFRAHEWHTPDRTR